MTRHDPLVRLRHMLDYSREAVRMVQGKTRKELDDDRQLNLALTHLVELIGEAAGQVPRATQKRYPDIPWPKIVSMRNRLIQATTLWTTIFSGIPSCRTFRLSSTR
jgi:uncharacterized protein with HEPN domain